MDTDFPRAVQIDSAREGVIHFMEFPEDEDGLIDGPPREYGGTFADALQVAIDHGVFELTIGGLSINEAVDLLLSPRLHPKTIELFEANGIWGEIVSYWATKADS